MATGLLFGLGALLSILGVVASNAFASSREDRARQENYKYNELSAEKSDERTRALYEDLQSPSALRQQYEEAGLSPSIMFGGKGLGGQLEQGAQGQGATGISPSVFGTNGLEAAQIANIKADTELKKAQTETESGENERGQAEINEILTNITNTKLKGEVIALDTTLKNFEVALKGEYAQQEMELKIKQLTADVNKVNAQTRVLNQQGDITDASKDAIINYNKEKVYNITADTALKRMQTKLTEANISLTKQEVLKLQNDILVDNANVEVSRRKVTVDENALKEQVAQWAKQNGYTEKGQNIKIAEIIVDAYLENSANIFRLIDSVIPN